MKPPIGGGRLFLKLFLNGLMVERVESVNCVSVGVFYFLLGCKPHSIHKHIGTRRSLTDACYTEAGFFSTEAEPPLYFVSRFFFQHHPPEPDLTFVVIPGIFSAHYQIIQGKLKVSITS